MSKLIMLSQNLFRLLPLLGLIHLSSAFAATPWMEMDMVGETKFNYLFWKVYEARLYANEKEFRLTETRPFALAITYRRDFDKDALVSETRRQWERMDLPGEADIPEMLEAVNEVLVSVSEDDTIVLYVDENGTSHFYLNNSLLGQIPDPEFSLHFASIWLSENSSRPALTEELLGKS